MMNKRGHVLNAILLAIGLGYVLEPSGDIETFIVIAQLSIPITLGALFPDVDTDFGKHRKTLHNLPILAIFVIWPIVFNNLHYVWIGILTHYILDLAGSKRGIALFYPYKKEYNLPIGVPVSSSKADIVTVIITVAEVALFAVVHWYIIPLDTAGAEITTVVGL